MEYSVKKWHLNSKINKERDAGFVKPSLWLLLIEEVFGDETLSFQEQVEVALFVVSSFCEVKSLEFSEGYLMRLQRSAVASARGCYRVQEGAYRAYEALANAAAIQLFKKMTTDRQMACEVPASLMPEFTRNLRRRMGATWAPLPADVP